MLKVLPNIKDKKTSKKPKITMIPRSPPASKFEIINENEIVLHGCQGDIYHFNKPKR